MNRALERTRRAWQHSLERFSLIGVAPFVGGIALADYLLRKDLNENIEFVTEIASGVLAHQKFHKLMGTEIHFVNDEGPPIGYRTRQLATVDTQPQNNEQQR